MRNLLLYFLIILVSFKGFSQQAMNATEIANFKANVLEVSKNTHTMKCDFEQYKHLSFLNNDVKTLGNLLFKTPDLILWQYTDPINYSTLFKDGFIHINDNGKKSSFEIGTNKAFQTLNNIIINSLKGGTFEPQDFDSSYYQEAAHFIVYLVPKSETLSSFIQKIELTFDKSTYDVTEIKLIEQSDDYTKIVLKNKKRNATIPNAAFR